MDPKNKNGKMKKYKKRKKRLVMTDGGWWMVVDGGWSKKKFSDFSQNWNTFTSKLINMRNFRPL